MMMDGIEKITSEEIVEVFIVDGVEFDSIEEAEKFKKKWENLLSKEFLEVSCHPDLTEGRGYYQEIIVAVDPEFGENLALPYLKGRFGGLISLVQGCAAMASYSINNKGTFKERSELENFLERKTSSLGNYHSEKRELVFLSVPKEEGELEKLGRLHRESRK